MSPQQHTPQAFSAQAPSLGVVLILAGGTGGHIFPGLAVAEALRQRGWRVHWLGGRGSATAPSMESRLVPAHGFAMELVDFSGVRGKGLMTLLKLPVRLTQAVRQSWQILRRIRPDVVVGLGGYISVPAGLACALSGTALVLHEQNAVAGMANRMLALVAQRVYTAFPGVLSGAQWVGNPLRSGFLTQAAPAERFAERVGPLRVLVVGGSLGAQVLNQIVPRALALIPLAKRPLVRHQSGEKQIAALRAEYEGAGVQAELTPFIDDTAQAFAEADLVICRAGASTVTELAAVGVAAVYVPVASAVDDHQTRNAEYLVKAGGGWLLPQSELTPQALLPFLLLSRKRLLAVAIQAKAMEKRRATEEVVAACEELKR